MALLHSGHLNWYENQVNCLLSWTACDQSLSNLHMGVARRMWLQTAVAATVGSFGRLWSLGISQELLRALLRELGVHRSGYVTIFYSTAAEMGSFWHLCFILCRGTSDVLYISSLCKVLLWQLTRNVLALFLPILQVFSQEFWSLISSPFYIWHCLSVF